NARLFRGETEAQVLHLVMTLDAPAPSTMNNAVPPALDDVVLKGLSRDPAQRFATAREMAVAIEAAVPVATPMKVAEWIDGLIGQTLAARDAMRAEIESGSHSMRQVSSEPLSQPSLPGFPQIADSSASIPRLSATGAGDMAGNGESSASAVMVAPHIPSRSRVPWVIAIVAVVGALGIAIGVVFSRPATTPVQSQPVATQTASHVEAPLPPSAQTQATTQAPSTPSQSAVLSSGAPSTTASHHTHGPTKPPQQTHTGPAGSGNDLNTLLDTR
ncbi:MAG TPA: hypothetical protein VGH87_01180, partial [Polyangiaceae bacterium]